MSYVLVINSGSSSIKVQIVDPAADASDTPFVSGLVEQIGEPQGRVTIKHDGQKYVVQKAVPTHADGCRKHSSFSTPKVSARPNSTSSPQATALSTAAWSSPSRS